MPRRSDYWGPPSRSFPFKADHALFAFEPLLKFVNTPVTEKNYAQLVMPGASSPQNEALVTASIGNLRVGGAGSVKALSAKRVSTNPRASQPAQSEKFYMLTDYKPEDVHVPGYAPADPDGTMLFRQETLARPRPRLAHGAVLELQGALRRALDRFMQGAEDPLIDPRTGKLDFTIAGRWPFEGARGTVDFEGNDLAQSQNLQDYWYRMARILVTKLRQGEDLVRLEGSHRYKLSFRPLKKCPRCMRFFFRRLSRQVTCGRRPCTKQASYLKHPKATH